MIKEVKSNDLQNHKKRYFQGYYVMTQNQNHIYYLGEQINRQLHGQGLLIGRNFRKLGEFQHDEPHKQFIWKQANEIRIVNNDQVKDKYWNQNKWYSFIGVIFRSQIVGRTICQTNDICYGNIFNGRGVQTKKEIYEGDFLGSRPHGQGLLRTACYNYYGAFFEGYQGGYGRKVYINGDTYSGQFRYDEPYGLGSFSSLSGRYCVGCWNDVELHGFGTEIENDTISCGQFKYGDPLIYVIRRPLYAKNQYQKCTIFGMVDNDKVQGQMQMIPTDKSYVYVGGQVNAKMHGIACMIIQANGIEFYIGSFTNHKKQGWGYVRFSCGSLYEGEFYAGERQGYGQFSDSQGKLYKGYWYQDQQQGYGITVDYRDLIKKTNYVKSQPIGQVLIICQTGQYDVQYTGAYQNRQKHGYGSEIVYRFNHKSSQIYVGDWEFNQRSGNGTIIYPSGNKYIGQFQKGLMNGYGTYYKENGQIYEGMWVDNLRNGPGVEASQMEADMKVCLLIMKDKVQGSLPKIIFNMSVNGLWMNLLLQLMIDQNYSQIYFLNLLTFLQICHRKANVQHSQREKAFYKFIIGRNEGYQVGRFLKLQKLQYIQAISSRLQMGTNVISVQWQDDKNGVD